MAVRIGITSSPNMYDGRLVDEVTRAYVASVLRAGGLPIIVPVLDRALVADMLDGLDGLLLSGGGDIEPRRYGGVAVPEIDGVDPARDEWELALVAGALDRGLPVLGICRGAQVINVAAGGTLVPDLGAVSDVLHRDRDRFDEDVHPVEVLAGSRLAWAMGREHVGVNTLHHQAVDEVGLGLQAVAWSPDGVIEAIEGIARGRVLGVQWHPELLSHLPGNPELFQWLVAEASRARTMADAVATGLPPLAPMNHGTGIDLVDAVA
jgi:putative glutamine amidotransferase